MYLVDDTVVTSASDLKKASDCEFAFLRELDVKLGRETRFEPVADAMLERAGRLGDEHEERVLQRYRDEFGAGVVEIDRPDLRDPDQLAAAVEATREAFASGAPVVFQATFVDDGFVGFADFIVRQPDGRYLVQDSKLARRARVTALLQLAAYATQLDRIGVPRADTVELLLGDGTTSSHRLADVEPVYLLRRDRLRELVDERVADDGPVAWGDPRYGFDGRCPTCDLEVQAHRDLLLVAGLRTTQRQRFVEAGIITIDALAASSGPVDGVLDATLDGLRVQARLQLAAEAAELAAEAAGERGPDDPPLPPPVEVREPGALAAIPEPDPGDLFFDFEGDPLYTEGAATDWGLDYLFGMIDVDERFTPIWAHSFAEEREALLRFLALVKERRERHPNLHIYHYASYERTHLTSIAARHGVGEAEVDQLLADGVLVDLYPVVKRAVRVGSRSYSIKKLEPLYMGDELREADVKSGGDSILEYVRARDLQGRGETAAGELVLADLAEYNRYDCVSTLRLRDWLLGLARAHGVAPVPALLLAEPTAKQYEASPLALDLNRLAGPAVERGDDPDRAALALAAAAIDYHDREMKTFWWGHFFRVEQPLEAWEDHRDVLVVDPSQTVVMQEWYREGRQQQDRRELLLRGRIAPGSRFGIGADVHLLYDWPAPFPSDVRRPGSRASTWATVLDVAPDGVRVEEKSAAGETWRGLPTALVPGPPPRAGSQKEAIAEWARAIVEQHPRWPHDPATDLLRRVPPRTRSGSLAALPDHEYVGAVVRSLGDLDDSYLAVQGPPGTGKTYVASHVIARLVGHHGWRVGVVAQSHAVVEHLLDAVVTAGLDPALVGKALKAGDEQLDRPWTVFPKAGAVGFAAANAQRGFVLGGTAWDFSNPTRVARRSLDLLVVDEAGQFSLASTIAASVAARRLLLLGDPQQLPQVSQGTHPEPVDMSALGWIADGHDVLPAELGYFLAESRRMHPALAAPVSHLSYEGELESHDCAALRSIDGIEPGLTPIPVEHEGNTTESAEEAAEVVRLASSLIGRGYTDTTAGSEPTRADPRPLTQADLIVVTPYNAQLTLVRDALDRAGLRDVPVGTVDKFQGQEAAVAIVTLAASSAAAAPRGIEFLLLKNRLNVAISRAKVAAYLVYSPGLLDALPRTPQGVTQLSAFARLVGVELPSLDRARLPSAAG